MRTAIPLGGADQNYNSREGRTQAINCYIERNQSGSFKRIRRVPGLRQFADVGDGPIRAMFGIKEFLYIVSGPELYRIDKDANSTLLGNVGGATSRASINANGTDDNQIIVVSAGNGYLYDDSSGFQTITDPDFDADVYVASLNQIFYTNKPDSNVFIGSGVADGTDWPATKFASAEQNPDILLGLVAQKSALRLLGSRTVEYWQTDTSAAAGNIPLRPVVGATVERGVGAQFSITQWQDSIFFLADDFTVWMLTGSKAQKISDINLEYAIRGEGFGDNAGYSRPDLAEGFFIDHPTHKLYVLTFPFDRATWVYDVASGFWHRRESQDIGRWRGRESSLAFRKVLVGDYRTGVIWEFEDGVFTEGDDPLPYELVTPPVSDDAAALYITEMELSMEVGVGTIGNVDALGVPKALPITPEIQVFYSKDGGVTFTKKPDVSIGPVGDRYQRVRSRLFGRVRQNQNFVLKFRVTDDVPVVMYNLFIDVEKGN